MTGTDPLRAVPTYRCEEFRPFAEQPGVCDGCGKPLTGRRRVWCSAKCERAYQEQHYWVMARHAAKRRDQHRCTHPGCDVRHSLEVNHIEPRNGAGYGWGCWNHLSNLETLCHSHHLEVTARQRAGRSV